MRRFSIYLALFVCVFISFSSTASAIAIPKRYSVTPPPAVPTNVAGLLVNQSQVNITWKGISDAVSYNVFVNDRQYRTGVNQSACELYGLPQNATHKIQVQAVNYSGYSELSTPIYVSIPLYAPSMPQFSNVAPISPTQIDFYWEANPVEESVTKYNLRILGNGTEVVFQNIAYLSYSVKDLRPNTFYEYQLEAVNAKGITKSGWGRTYTLSNTPLVPKGFRAIPVSSSQVNLLWDAPEEFEGVDSYTVMINDSQTITGIKSRSYEVKNLQPNKLYGFKVRAVSANGIQSDLSEDLRVSTASLLPPIKITPQVVSSNQINVFWDSSPSSDLIGYNLRIDGSQLVTNIKYLSYAVTSFAPNSTHTFEVQAVDFGGNVSAWTTPISATTSPVAPPQTPNIPSGLDVRTFSPTQIDVSWRQNASADNVISYSIRVNGTVITGIQNLSYSIKNLTPNTIYTIQVQAVNTQGVSFWSAPLMAVTAAFEAPQNVSPQVVSSSQINLFWNASASQNISSYNLRINGSQIIFGITYLSYAVRNLNANTPYTFEVQGVDSSGGVSVWSTPVIATTGGLGSPPSAPIGLSLQAISSSQINAFWNQNSANENVTSYNLRVNSSTVISDIRYLSYAVRNLSSNTTYTIEVQAVNAQGVSVWSVPVSVATSTIVAPQNISPQAVSTTQINVFWNPASSPNISSYNLRINGSQMITGITYLSYPLKNLNPGTNYTFEVQAVDSSGAVSNWSAPVSARTQPLPSTPIGVSPQVISSSQINIFWTANPASENIVSYNLRVNGGARVFTDIRYLSYAVKDLSNGMPYQFEVQAVNAAGATSNWSLPISAVAGEMPVSPPAKITTQVISANQINVFWDAAPSPGGAIYYLRINGSQVISGIFYLSYAVKNLNPNTTYTFEVQTATSSGALSPWSQPVTTTTPATNVSAPARVITQVISANQINLFWDASTSPNVVRYNIRVNGMLYVPEVPYLSYAIKNFSPNTTYTFEVQAIDSSGNVSAWSSPVTATTPPL